jgi:predicted nucleic acid-binding protein
MNKTRARWRLWQYGRLQGRIILVDANVVIYTFWPGKNTQKWMGYYRKMVLKMLGKGFRLAVDSHIISEVINVVLRKDWAELMRIHPELGYAEFKEFRDSAEGQAAQARINDVVENQIFPVVEVVERSYSKADMLQLLVINRLDFVDRLLVLLCEEGGYALLTNDGDFIGSDIDILSNNNIFFPVIEPPPVAQT